MNTKDTERNTGAGGSEALASAVEGLSRVRGAISSVIVGQADVVELSLIALLCEGHVLYEGVPGLGKTMLVRTLAETMGLVFSRIQFTPDLMPADVIGTTMIASSERKGFELEFEEGPVFANLVLADEINRASPKTQSALLEAMQERAATVRGKRHPMPRPFQVLATQNPLEMEGTYPLPEAQTDRFFFKILVKHPSHEDLMKIVERTVGEDQVSVPATLTREQLATLHGAVRAVVAPPHIIDLASRFVLATQPERPEAYSKVRQFLRFGAGPRGAQTLVLAAKARALMHGRFNAAIEDLEYAMLPAMRHRVSLNFDGQSEAVDVDALLLELFAHTKAAAEHAPELKR